MSEDEQPACDDAPPPRPRSARPPRRRGAPPPRKRSLVWLYVVAFMAGAALMAFELVGSRLLAPYFGNSIFVWGSLIAVFLTALSIGYTVGGRLADRFPTYGALSGVLALGSVLVAIMVVLGDPIQSQVVHWNIGLRLNPLLSSVVIFVPASVLMGMVSPWAVRLGADDISHVGTTAGMVFAVSTAGSVLGTLATAFWLIQSFGSDSVVLIIAAALAACSIVCAMRATTLRWITLGITALVFTLVAGTTAGADTQLAPRTGDWSPVFRAGGYRQQFQPTCGGKQRKQVDSAYHRIRVVDYDGCIEPDTVTRVMHFDNSLQAGVALDDQGDPDLARAPLFDYLRSFDVLPAIRPDAGRVLFIGLGSGAAPMRLHQLRPELKIDVVEIDPEVVRLARVWFDYDDDAIHTEVGDGRSWLAASDHRYDAVVVDAYFADSIPFHLTTREFLDVVRDHLTRDGVVVANLIGAIEGPKNELMRSMAKTYRDEFDHLLVLPIPHRNGKVGLRDFNNVTFYAGDHDVPTPASLQHDVSSSDIFARIDDTTMQGVLEHAYTGTITGKGVPLLTDDYAPVDALLSVNPDDA